MAKIQIKSEKLTPLGGISHFIRHFALVALTLLHRASSTFFVVEP